MMTSIFLIQSFIKKILIAFFSIKFSCSLTVIIVSFFEKEKKKKKIGCYIIYGLFQDMNR